MNPFAGKNDDVAVIEYVKAAEPIECTQVGMAFTLIKKEVLDAVQEQTVDGPIWSNTDRVERKSFQDEVANFEGTFLEAIAMGQNSHIGTTLLGEDISFCRKAIKLGFKCYTHTGVIIGHMGKQSFSIIDTLKQKEAIVAC